MDGDKTWGKFFLFVFFCFEEKKFAFNWGNNDFYFFYLKNLKKLF